jgi:hypothetical protein
VLGLFATEIEQCFDAKKNELGFSKTAGSHQRKAITEKILGAPKTILKASEYV